MSDATTALEKVDEMARKFVDNGKFPTMQQARTYVFETRPALEEQVRAETVVAPPMAKAVLTVGEAAVEKAARELVDAGTFPTIQQARAHVYETMPQVAEKVRKERA